MSPLLLALSLATLVLSQEYLIVPNNQSSCHTNATCFTLDQLAQTDLTNRANLTLIFQEPGEHTLTRTLIIQGFTHVDIIGQNTPEINLQGVPIELSDIDQLSIKGLSFNGHMSFSITNANNLFITSCYFTGLNTLSVRNSENVRIDNVMFNESVDTALWITETDTVSIENSTFTENQGMFGGAVHIVSGTQATISIENSTFTGNQGEILGGAVFISSYTVGTIFIELENSTFTGNQGKRGGAVYIDSYTGTISIESSTFTGNQGEYGAGAVYLQNADTGTISIENSTFTGNQGVFNAGAVLIYSHTGTISIENSTFTGNQGKRGGAVYIYSDRATTIISIVSLIITGNIATDTGSAIHVEGSQSLEIIDNMFAGNTGGTRFLYLQNIDTVTFLEENTISGNNGSLYVFNSKVFFNGSVTIEHGASDSGAIHAIQSRIFFNIVQTICHNTALGNGGGLFLQESSLFVNSPVIISHNTANEGGAIYAYQSTIEFSNVDCYATLANNSANNGGGIYAIASIIRITKSFINIESNTAQANGGGLYLQQSSRMYILKESYDRYESLESKLTISNNHTARLGGGIYVDDSTASGGACRSNAGDETVSTFLGECFIQTIGLHGFFVSNIINTFITNNTVDQKGSSIYGGLLDRCTVSSSSEVTDVPNGLEYIKTTVELPVEDIQTISSDPLQLKLCANSKHSRKGHSITVHVKAIDQVGNPVNATIRSSVVTKNGLGRLKEGQVEQQVGSECTKLEYNVYSEDSFAQLELYADGPCSDLGLSKFRVNITFLNCSCPLGFHQSSQSNIECICECDEELQASGCFPQEETFLLNNTVWVGTANFTDCGETGYVVHNCPFSYCVDQPVNISLNSSQQIDRQCAYNRTGVLCGECEEGLSLVFASSKCKECSNTYLLLLIPFAVAGIALVVFILSLNITVANGTIYGLIYFANVLAANKAIFLPFRDPSFLTVFVSWVNLDLGIETCFYDGMNSQAKVLLQLAFAAYLFVLMFLIIILSKYVNSFAKLLSNRNPVAALCTLLTLSISKLSVLRLIITALQFTSLFCPDGSYKTIWLYDGNVNYFSSNHIPLFIAAAVILTAFLLFSTLLFFGQWFPRCSKWKVMKWTNNTKYIGFMDAFHAPFTPKHRYWPGLLLFALITYNVVSSLTSNSSVPILYAGCVAVGLIVYKFLMNRVYKNKFNSTFETIFLLNVTIFALGTYHYKITNQVHGQLAFANVSMTIAFILFVVITCYHFYKYVVKKSNVWDNLRVKKTYLRNKKHSQPLKHPKAYLKHQKPRKNADIKLEAIVDMYSNDQTHAADPNKYITPPIIRPATRPDQLREPDLDILAPITTEDYGQAPPSTDTENRPKPVVTYTVVEID